MRPAVDATWSRMRITTNEQNVGPIFKRLESREFVEGRREVEET